MNAYDFDGTIYQGDSSVDFFLFCLRRHPAIARRFPAMLRDVIRYCLHRIDKTSMKTTIFGFVRHVPNPHAEVRAFWDTHISKVMDWYRYAARPDDIVISASPVFLLEDACARLGIATLIASEVDAQTGAFLSPNCHDTEKVRRLRALLPQAEIENFYSDSYSDQPMADLAHTAWLIKKGRPVPWQ